MIDLGGADDVNQRWRLRALSLGLALIAALLPASDGRAEVSDPDARSRFGLFFEAGPHVTIQRGKGRVDSNFNVRSDKTNILTNMTFRLGGGLKAPAIESVWGKPRPVVWAAALVPLNESSTIGVTFIETNDPPGTERLELGKYSIEYQTSALAGAGLEFRVPVFDSAITVMPGVESLHLGTRYVGLVGLEINRAGSSTRISLRQKKDIFAHFVGPALRIGAPTIVFRGVAINFHLNTSLLLDVQGTRREMGASDGNGHGATFTFETGSGLVQVGAGLQIRWP